MTREQRALGFLLSETDGMMPTMQDEIIAAILAFANSELERAAKEAESLKRLVPYEYNSHPCTTTMKRISKTIRAMMEEE